MCNLKDVNRGANQTILQISLLLLLTVFFFRKCIRLIVQVTEQNKCLFHNFYGWFSNLNQFKRSIPESFKHEYTILPVPCPSNPPPPPPPPRLPLPIRFNVGISTALSCRPIQNSYATIACDTSIERRPTLIRVRGICLPFYHILLLQNGISVLNMLVVFQITLCEHNLNFGKTKQYAIRQIKLQNWTEETKVSAK